MDALWVTGGGWYARLVLKKTSLYLDPAVDRGLTRLAEREGVTKAEAIRRILARWDEYLSGFGA